jgi:hypothetical protein
MATDYAAAVKQYVERIDQLRINSGKDVATLLGYAQIAAENERGEELDATTRAGVKTLQLQAKLTDDPEKLLGIIRKLRQGLRNTTVGAMETDAAVGRAEETYELDLARAARIAADPDRQAAPESDPGDQTFIEKAQEKLQGGGDPAEDLEFWEEDWFIPVVVSAGVGTVLLFALVALATRK